MKSYFPAAAFMLFIFAASTAYGSDWSGFYLGFNAGYTSGNYESVLSPGAYSSEAQLSPSGTIGGLLAGYNFESNRILIGVEGDYQFHNHAGGDGFYWETVNGWMMQTVSTSNFKNFTTIRGRLGYEITAETQAYGTAGVAIASFNNTALVTMASEFGSDANFYAAPSTHIGIVFGGGIERRLSKNLYAKFEYIHSKFSIRAVPVAGFLVGESGSPRLVNADTSLNTFRGGLNFHF